MGQPPEEGGLNPPQAQSTIHSFLLVDVLVLLNQQTHTLFSQMLFCCYSKCESTMSLSLLQHFINQREEFETARDGILVWLTEMDLQLTNIEHFSECDIQAKIKQLRVSLSHTNQSFVLTMKTELMGIYLCSHSHSNRKYPSLQPKSSTSSTRERH